MAILTVRNKASSAPGKYVGVYLDQEISSYLSLYALSKEITKSVIVRDQMKEWYKGKRVVSSEKELVETIAIEIKKAWELRNKSSYLVSDIKDFKKQLKIELHQKGISEDHISAILATFRSR